VRATRGALWACGLSDKLDNSTDFTNNPESKRGQTLLEARLWGEAPMTENVIIRSSQYTVDDPAFQAAVARTTASLRAETDAVARASNYYEAIGAGSANAMSLVSDDRHTTIIPLTMVGDVNDAAVYGERYIEVAQAERATGFEVYATGAVSSDVVYGKIADEDLGKDLQIGLPVAALVLVVVFGALVAAGLPILLGIISIIGAMGLTAIVAGLTPTSDSVIVMITMIGLAVGIDYALFVVERYREERRHGKVKEEAIDIAAGTAGKAVLFSGGTVILALMGMFLIPVSVFHSLAAGAILSVVVAVAATQTVIPALLRLLGDKIDWPRKRRYDDAAIQAAQRRYDHETIHAGFWGRVTKGVMAHPVITLVIAVTILLGLALPVLDIKTGQPGTETLPDSDVKTGYEILADEFSAGNTAPVYIAIDGAVDDPAVVTGTQELVEALAGDHRYGLAAVTQAPSGDLTLVTVPMTIDPNSDAAYQAVRSLRSDTIPAAYGERADDVYVTGNSAGTEDFNATMTAYTPIVYAFVLTLSFLLLMVAFRSVVVPLKAIVMNLLSVGAAYGALVAVFQKGYLADTLGLQQAESIAPWIPVFLFSILFGLSMDYHVFLLSRIREHFDQTGDNDASVAVGLQSTAKIITGAALIMVAVFAGFATGRMVEIQQVGFGLAFAVFLDATVVRSLLVPASMKLLGDRNWYLPRWLGWLPKVNLEGETVPLGSAPVLAPAPAYAAGGDD
jgi:RND superfamily putative drug exporter